MYMQKCGGDINNGLKTLDVMNVFPMLAIYLTSQ